MKRLAIICTVVSGTVLILGLVEMLTNFHWPTDQDPLFGNPRLLINDGATALIAGGFLAVVTALLWAAVLRRGRSHQHRA
jgi:hypothetical protein